MHNLDFLACNTSGFVRKASCQCCLHVKFQNLFWRISSSDFQVFAQYIHSFTDPTGFAQNEVEPGYALVAMEGERLAALLSAPELQNLHQLLEQAQLELLRQNLSKAYESTEHVNDAKS